MKKQLDISEEAVKALSIQAIKEKTVFKLYAQRILEDAAMVFIGFEDNQKSSMRKQK